MRERGILFSAPMVRALLAGTKTQTRRALRDQDPIDLGAGMHGAHLSRRPVFDKVAQRVIGHRMAPVLCPYGQPGDRLWVREAWRACRDLDSAPPRDIEPGSSIEFEATKRSYAEIGIVGKPRPGMFMPRWASRITLEVTGVRVERLNAISPDDAIAEGIERHDDDGVTYFGPFNAGDCRPEVAYRALWESINGAGSWDASPWVWVVEFRRIT